MMWISLYTKFLINLLTTYYLIKVILWCCDYNWRPQLLMKLEQRSWLIPNREIRLCDFVLSIKALELQLSNTDADRKMQVPDIIVEVCTSWSRHRHQQNKNKKLYLGRMAFICCSLNDQLSHFMLRGSIR